jgi:hypothetical protein
LAYKAFRPQYPDELFRRIVAGIPPEHRRRAVDLGAGTGLSTLPLCQWFEHVTAVEPDRRMAAEIPRNERLAVLNARAEDAELEPSSIDLVTAGTAFYWMDGPCVVNKVTQWLRRDGVLAVYRYGLPTLPPELAGVLEREFDQHWNQFRHQRLLDEEYSWRCLSGSRGLGGLERIPLCDEHQVSVQHVVGFFSSTSYGSAYLRTLSDPARYLQELESELGRLARGTDVAFRFPIELILARRLPAPTSNL